MPTGITNKKGDAENSITFFILYDFWSRSTSDRQQIVLQWRLLEDAQR